jgi:hypothetical protein
MLLIHGARAVLVHAKRAGQATAFQLWARATQARRGHNVATVAVANKIARIIWAVWVHQRPFAADYRDAGTQRPSITSSLQEDCTELN